MSITLDGSNANTVGVINSATAKNSTSGTSIDFTGIPAGTKRITVMFNGVSTNGSSNLQIQIGSGSVTTSGDVGGVAPSGGAFQTAVTTGLQISYSTAAASIYTGQAVFTLLNASTNVWTASGVIARNDGYMMTSGTAVTLSGALDRVRITTVNGTDTFDAGSINILYE